jgi:hypothetical protein
MDDLVASGDALIAAAEVGDHRAYNEAARTFVEQVTFAAADDITAMLRELLAADWTALPPWARNLSYRLACLQRPRDAALLREAAADLYSFGPDWDDDAERLRAEADKIDRDS